MIKNNGNKNKGKFLRFFVVSIFFITFVTISVYYYVDYSYKNLLTDFYSEFNNNNYDDARNIIKESNLVLKLNKNKLNTDLNDYFISFINKICTDIKNGKIMQQQATTIFKEIKDYNIVDNSIDKLILSIDKDYVPTDINSSESTLTLAISQYKQKNYSEAIKLFNSISSSDIDFYAKAKSYINKCKSDYKTNLFEETDKLVANKYYTKAIELLNNVDSTIVTSDDSDIKKKINSIENFKSEYLATGFLSDSEYTSNAILHSITMNNINTLNIESKTEYFLYVNLEEQKTYVYRGSKNDWNLYKSFYCSTGIAGEETPKGIYAISDRGDWFYSDDYDQGGKYWVRFMGDYLFHSLPYDESATNIVDDTLGRAASHGCIRLKLDDAKWIYDNVNKETKVIIN